MKITEEMYWKIFNHATDTYVDLQKIIDKAQKVMLELEELYVNQES